MISDVLDGLILVWLIGTWFYEGHHRRPVRAICPECFEEHDLHPAPGDDARRLLRDLDQFRKHGTPIPPK